MLALLLYFEAARVFDVGGVAPNLLLIFFAVIFTGTKFGRSLTAGECAAYIVFLCAAGALLFYFWFPEILGLSCIIAVMYFLRDKAIGTPFLDMLLFLIAGTTLFYGALAMAGAGDFFPGIVLQDAAYTALLGSIAWGVVRYTAYA